MIRRVNGFTLIELIVTIAIAGILLVLAVPGYQSFIQNNRVVDMTNRLSGAFSLARMEAIKRGTRVSVCPAANTALNSCGTAGQWTQGWIVFSDPDNNDTIDNNADRIAVFEALPNFATIASNQAIVSYDSTGFLSSGALTMTLASTGCTGNNSRILTITTSGRLSIGIAACS